MWVTKADSRACDAGTLPCSEMPFLLQKQCHICSPVLYMACVSSSHVCTMVSFTQSCLLALAATLLGGTGWVLVEIHILSQSLARQCGCRMEGIGIRYCGYGAGPLGVALEVDRMGRLHGLVLLVIRHLRALDTLLTQFSPGSLLHVTPFIAASLARLLQVCVD